MTEFLFRQDPYRAQAEATVIESDPEGGIVLDRTIFYATSGGQPGDTGTMVTADGTIIDIIGSVHPQGDKTRIAHLADADSLPQSADVVELKIDWARRHKLMRMHSALHLLSVVMPFPVTGGSVGEEKGRLDFDMPEVPENIEELERTLNRFVTKDHPITSEWISDAELQAKPDLVKTMSVKPPSGQGQVRLVRIGTPDATVDLQPCGGTHVARTGEIGALRIGKIEKKGKQNRRVNLHFAG